MIKIAFFNRKGGTGKTTSVVNIAATFAVYRNKKVLVVDCDSQMTATDYLLNNVSERKGYSVKDVLAGFPLEQALEKTVVDDEDGETINVSVLPSSIDIETIPLKDELDVLQMLEPVEKKFDYCFFDLPPHLNGIAKGALVACDYIIVPAMADTDSLSGFNMLMDIVSDIRATGKNTHIEIMGILFNNVVHQRAVQKYVLASTKEAMGDLVFNQQIKAGSIVEQARYSGFPLICYARSHEIINQYQTLTKEIEMKIKGKGNNKHA